MLMQRRILHGVMAFAPTSRNPNPEGYGSQAAEMTAPKRKLRWYQYSLGSLMLLTHVVSLGMSWFAARMKAARQQKAAVEGLEKFGGQVLYDYEVDQSGNPLPFPRAKLPGPAWLRKQLGNDFFATVVELYFSPPSVTDAGLEHLKGLSQLQSLTLEGTQVTDAGLKRLTGLTQFRTLDLNETRVTDAALVHLKGLTKLSELDLHNTKVTNEGVKRLQQALPNCKIFR